MRRSPVSFRSLPSDLQLFPDLTPYIRRLPSTSVPVVHTDSYVCGLPKGHRFQMGKFRGVYQSLVKDKVVDPRGQVLEPPRASMQLSSLAHEPEYVERFYEGWTTKEEQKRTGFVWTHGLASRVRYETGIISYFSVNNAII